MKIGVVTFWHGKSNYGMMMQCWALQTFLKQIGHDPYVIRFAAKPHRTFISKILRLIGLYDILKTIQSKLNGVPTVNAKSNDKKRGFDEFLNSHITCSLHRYYTIQELRKNPPVADCYITGSDQVWAQILNNENNFAYFLDFGSSSVKRLAYAPSFSMKQYPEEYKNILKAKLKRFDAISCREYDGVNICKSLGFDAVKALDPTLLLERDVYLELCKDVPVCRNRNAFIYSLNIANSEQIKWNELRQLIHKDELKAIVTPSDGYLRGAEIFGDDVEYKYSTPQQWLASIRDAEFVVTPSFHGIVFAILLNKPFVYVPLSGSNSSGNNRVLDLLSDLNLNERVLADGSTYEGILSRDICWAAVNERLVEQRGDSIDYLLKHL